MLINSSTWHRCTHAMLQLPSHESCGAKLSVTSTKHASLLVRIIPVLCLSLAITACTRTTPAPSPYAGQQLRTIKSLSPDDIAQLRAGGGWGLAKAAELNGMPGPRHVLDMQRAIGLTPAQETAVQAVFEKMRAAAIPLGVELIEKERVLNDAFARRSITNQQLMRQLDAIANTLSKLRYVHLEAHLATTAILTAEQVANYNELRGYGTGDPCASVPAGHDPVMWRQHNGCASE